MSFQRSLTLHPLSNYSMNTKGSMFEKERTNEARFQRLKEEYERQGMRRSVVCILLVDNHAHPHVLLLQLGSHFFKLPGGELRPGEQEQDGITRILNETFSAETGKAEQQWPIGDLLSKWWRPHFETCQYPYVPAHVSRPKELKQMFVIQLPEKCQFNVPSNFKLVAVPLFELYDNKDSYGHIIASVPQLLSKYSLVRPGVEAEAEAAAAPERLEPEPEPEPEQEPEPQADLPA